MGKDMQYKMCSGSVQTFLRFNHLKNCTICRKGVLDIKVCFIFLDSIYSKPFLL